MRRPIAVLALFACLTPTAASAQDAGGLENSTEFQETQEFINRTQAKIDQVRRENDARAKEIEAIANRVGEVISTMSSQGEDNSNLRSEMQKLTGLLEIERETASGLKGEVAKLTNRMKADRASWEKREKDLEAKVREAEDASRASAQMKLELAKLNDRVKSWDKREKDLEAKIRASQEANRAAEKRLGAALESIAGHARTNRQLVNDIEALQKEVDRLRKENEFLRRLRSANPSLPLQR